jgi:hypothetical protein
MDLTDVYEKKKKVSSRVREILADLIHEAIALLGELPTFDITIKRLFENEGVAQGLVSIYPRLPKELKQQLVLFIGRIRPVPPALLEVFTEDKASLQTHYAVSVLVNNSEKYKDVIDANLTGKTSGALSLLILRLLESEGPSDRLVGPILKGLPTRRCCAIFPFVELLKNRPKIVVDEEGLIALYSQVSREHDLLTLYSLLALSFLTDELDWICGAFCGYLRGLTYTTRCALLKTIFATWTAAIEHHEVIMVFWALFEKMLLFFGDAIGSAPYAILVQKIAAIGAADDFLTLGTLTLTKLPSHETAIHLIHGASVVRPSASPQVFEKFVQAAKTFAESAGPILVWTCETMLGG